jgi:hypothetical protein
MYLSSFLAALKARATDTDMRQLYDVVARGSADSGVLRRIVGGALDGNPRGYAFSVANAHKDMMFVGERNEEKRQLEEGRDRGGTV